MVIVLLAVLSAVAVPRLVGRTAFESRAFADEVASAVRYAQRTAIAMRRTVTLVTANPGSPCALRLCLGNDCSQQVFDPGTSRPFCLVPPPEVSLQAVGGTPAGLQFDAGGRPSSRTTFTVSSSAPGDASRVITVEAETGHVH